MGLDTARYGHHVFCLGENLRPTCEPFSFQKSAEGCQKLRGALEQFRHPQDQLHIRIDAAGQ